MLSTITNKRSASSVYHERHAECKDLLNRIQLRLIEHMCDQSTEPSNWGYAGDLGKVSEELAYVLAALGDRSAVDAKGLDY